MRQLINDDVNLMATKYLNYEHPLVRECVRGAIAGLSGEVEKAEAIFYFVRDRIEYNFAPDVFSWEDLRASHTMEIGNGFCVQKAVLFAAMLRAAGIPSKVGFQDIRSLVVPQKYVDLLGDSIGYHGLNAVYLRGRWIRLDATLDKVLVEQRRYRLVDFSSTHDCLLPSTDADGRPHFVIVKDYGSYSDVPDAIAEWQLVEFKRLDDVGWKSLVRKEDASM
ncbi:MAG: transglutaminase-like domain-containing protein [Chloroflexi bacterium]|nr:transglutaminase-like domain-containing protein [Chloroflexota bacterium]